MDAENDDEERRGVPGSLFRDKEKRDEMVDLL